MEDQLFADTPSLESLIEQGLVTHLCTRDGGAAPDETAVLTALCAAVAGEIYRIDSLNFVFRIEETDLGGALQGTPFQKWAACVADNLLTMLNCAAEPRPLFVRALVKSQPPLSPRPDAAEPAPDPNAAQVMAEPAALADDLEPAALEAPVSDAAEATAEPAAPDDGRTEGRTDGQTDGSSPFEEREAVMEADPAALAAAVARIERAVAGGAVEDRLAALEHRFGAIDATLASLCVQIADQKDAALVRERMIDDLAQKCRKLPERTARHVAARADGLGPAAIALTGVLQRLEDRLGKAPETTPMETTLEALQARIEAMAASFPLVAPAADDTNARLAGLEEDLRNLPERAAAYMTARSSSLVPLHVALSGALHRLECQIDTLLGRAEPGPRPGGEPDLRLQMAEFLSRMERQFGDQGGTPVTRCIPEREFASQDSQ